MGILGADGAAVAIFQSPQALMSPVDTINGALKALVTVLGADSQKLSLVLKATADIIKSACEMGKDGMLQTVGKNPVLLRYTH